MIPPASAALRHKLRAVQPLLQRTELPATLPSPCVAVCRMDDSQSYCLGCLRTLEELRDWGRSDASVQRSIWLRIAERAQAQP
jgi:uncharacterized protein